MSFLLLPPSYSLAIPAYGGTSAASRFSSPAGRPFHSVRPLPYLSLPVICDEMLSNRSSELPAKRQQWGVFLDESASELQDCMNRLGLHTFLKNFPAPPLDILAYSNDTASFLGVYAQWLREEAGEHQLLKFAKALIDQGHVRLFVKLLSQPFAVDCAKLETLYCARDITDAAVSLSFITAGALGEKEAVRQERIPFEHRDFLLKHAETMRFLVGDPRPAINYLHATSTINDSQKVLIDAEYAAGSNWAEKLLYHTIGDEAASSQRRDRLVHAFLVSGNYRLFNILKDIADAKRLESFHRRPDAPTCFRLEDSSKENTRIAFPKFIRATPPFNGSIQNAIAEKGELFTLPEPSGLLHDLSVDFPDTNRATDLVYYRDSKADVCVVKGYWLLTGLYAAHPCILQSTLPPQIYPNFSKPKGLVLVINNYRFHPNTTLRNRDGTEVDEKNICSLLSKLGYHVLPPHRDITAAAMIDVMRWFADHPAHRLAGSSVVVVLTHGEYGLQYPIVPCKSNPTIDTIIANSDHFTGVDGRKCNLHHFISALNARNCPALAGKPKLFFVQACRGDYQDPGVSRHHRAGEDEGEDGVGGNAQSSNSSSQPAKFTSPNTSQPIRPSTSLSSALFACISGGRERDENRLGMNYSSTGRKGFNESGAPWTLENVLPTIGGGPHQSVPPLHFPNVGAHSSPSNVKMQDKVKDPTEADMLIAYATTPNHVSWRHNLNGTWFIQSICEVFSKSALNEDILTMMTRVNKRVAQVYESSGSKMKQIPEVASRLRRKFYFFPGVDAE